MHADLCDGITCSRHGQCVVNSTFGPVCKCERSYTGYNCSCWYSFSITCSFNKF